MHKILFVLSIFFFFTQLQAQDDYTHTRNASEKTKAAYKKAYAYYAQKDYKKAEKDFLKLIKKDPTFVNSYIIMSYLYSDLKDTARQIEQINKALAIASDYDPRLYLSLAKIYTAKEDYKTTLKHVDKFLTYEKAHPNFIKLAKKLRGDALFRPKALANPVPFNPQNLGENINSTARDYFPSVTIENELVYTVQKILGQKGQEDLYVSKKDKNGWTKSQPISGINTPENEAAQSISADGKLIVYTVCNRPGDMGSCDLYFSMKISGKWTTPRNIGAPINTRNWESQPSIAPNSDAIYFVRGGARGTGQKDLYITRLQEDGTWSTPEKIEELNTPYDESSPSIHPDGKTLYFSSKGHPGMGGYDLFVSKLGEDGKWQIPQNLGYPINTAKQEEALAVSLKGDIAYIASDREGGYGSLDIYSFELPQNTRPEEVTYIKGITKDAETKATLSAYVEIIDLKTQKRFTKLTTKRDGKFTVCLPTGEYALNARRPKYAFFSANYTLNESKTLSKAYQLEALLQPIKLKEGKKTHEPIVLENVFFETASAALKDISKAELNKLKAFLDENPTVKIQLNGHTDNIGQEKDNLVLSDKRADAVRQYLITNGIAAERMTAKGFGETKPIYSNDTVEGRAKNRRTEFQIID